MVPQSKPHFPLHSWRSSAEVLIVNAYKVTQNKTQNHTENRGDPTALCYQYSQLVSFFWSATLNRPACLAHFVCLCMVGQVIDKASFTSLLLGRPLKKAFPYCPQQTSWLPTYWIPENNNKNQESKKIRSFSYSWFGLFFSVCCRSPAERTVEFSGMFLAGL